MKMFKKPITWAVICGGCYFGALGIASMAYYSPEQFHNVEPTQEEYALYNECKLSVVAIGSGDEAFCARVFEGALM